MNKIESQKGQALILIAFGIVALIGFTALAVDGGRVFSDRRHAQNAADTSVLATALEYMQQYHTSSTPKTMARTKGLERAESNSYSNDSDSTVVVDFCGDVISTDPCLGLPNNADPKKYIRVKITSDVPMTFARVLGRSLVTNRVEAIAKVVVPITTQWFEGRAMVSTMEGCKGSDGPNDPFTVGGSGITVVNDSGIFVNSTCTVAFRDNGAGNLVTTDNGVCVRGGTFPPTVTGVTPPPDPGCDAVNFNMDDFPQPDPTKYGYCQTPGTITDMGGYYEATPGYYNQTFPNADPAGTLRLTKGVYCLNNGLKLNSNWTITTNLNGNIDGDGKPIHDPDDEGVLFYVPSGDVTFNGTSNMTVHAISSGVPAELLNYLFIIPETNDADVNISGNNGSQYTGAIFAPASHCVVQGASGTIGLDTQLICYDTEITGNGNIDITYHPENNPIVTSEPTMELTK